ncbi:MAG TPA: prepilin-type N-terminal cleavage/methylation domain-containing protein [Alphaproteobacteria bacterium]|nr:prepilin-type N-terminal cleavage/methylation domain-containing protein [Alphaproteobacteria bacterium]
MNFNVHKFYKMIDKNGFTLIEVLIAIVIITIGTLGLASLTVSVIHGNSFSNRLTIATTLAQDRMEAVKRLGYKNVSTVEGTEDYGSILGYEGYKRVTSISSLTSGMKRVEVQVSWKSAAHPVSMETILAE